jgi:membrane protein implicated in regulation of membrane protease activity
MIGIFQTVLALFAAKKIGSALEQEGKIAEVVEQGKVWRVWHKATFWFARSRKGTDFKPGDWVKVVGREGTVLFVEPMEEDEQ